MAKPPSYKRSQYLTQPRYQFQFTARIIAVILLVALLSAAFTIGMLWKHLHQPDAEPDPFVLESLIAIMATLLVQFFLAIPLAFLLGIRQSHRLIGPVTRLQRTLEALGKGDFSQRITVRPGDTLESLARSINKMAEQLQQRFPPPRS